MPARARTTDTHLRVVRSTDGARSLRSVIGYDAGAVLVRFRPTTFVPTPSRHSIQLDVHRHALVDPECLRFTNHSCDPNVVVDTARLEVRAIRRIAPGAEITYFYPSTEWSMAEPFACGCDSSRCLLTVAGAEYLSADVLAGYELAPHIRLLLERRAAGPNGEPLLGRAGPGQGG